MYNQFEKDLKDLKELLETATPEEKKIAKRIFEITDNMIAKIEEIKNKKK